MTTNITRIRPPQKFSGVAKVTVTALSFISFIGSWNLIARLENNEAQADETVSPAVQLIQPLPNPAQVTATPWPTIPPLDRRPDIPTLVPTLTTFNQITESSLETLSLKPIQLAPIPTPMPLPTLAPLPALSIPAPLPPVLQPQPHLSNQRSRSGGS